MLYCYLLYPAFGIPPLGTPLSLYVFLTWVNLLHDGKSDIRISRSVLYTKDSVPAAAMPQRNRTCLQGNSIATADGYLNGELGPGTHTSWHTRSCTCNCMNHGLDQLGVAWRPTLLSWICQSFRRWLLIGHSAAVSHFANLLIATHARTMRSSSFYSTRMYRWLPHLW